ncbi:MAG TPA: SUMF1/EgtB/PvdO family nonheme iron enzyme, partial [Planctomycetota bacterium]|nr:SUMF1/EgtB/PvdO family nonheme iron enzyme [Planctomycetota bacterium]
AEVYAKILKERPVPPSAVEPDIDATLQSIVLRALEKAPEDRFQSAEEFQKALKSYREGKPVEEPKPSGKSRAVTARIEKPSGTSARGSALMKRSSDRAPAKRTSATIATITASDRFPRAQKSSPIAFIVAGVGALAVGGLVLIAGSNKNKPVDTTDDSHNVAVVAPVQTRTTPSDPGQADPQEASDVAAAIAAETDSGVPFSLAIKNWKDIAARYPSRSEEATRRASAIAGRADGECELLLRAADETVAQGQWGKADQDLQAVLLRFGGLDAEQRIEQKRKAIADSALAVAMAAAGDSDASILRRDFAAAIAAVSSPDRTGIAQADRLLQDQRAKVERERLKQEKDAAVAAKDERDKVPRLLGEAYELTKQRRYDESLKKYDEALAAPLDDGDRGRISLKRQETALIQSVYKAAFTADVDQAVRAKRDVTVEVAKNVKLPAVRVKDGVLHASAKGSDVEYDIPKLPAKGIAKLQELAPGGQEGPAILARALFLLAEGELAAARSSLDAARKAGADVSAYEGKFPAPPEPAPPPATGPKDPVSPSPPKTGEEKPDKPIRDVNALLPVEAGQFLMGYGAPKNENGTLVFERAPDGESPEHKVNLHDYRIGKYEVTNGQYKRFLDWIAGHKKDAHKFCHESEPANHDHTPALWKSSRFGGDSYPVVGVDWWDAYACCRFLGGRLPTEAEWERAARGTDSTRVYPWGKEFDWKKCVCASFWMKADALNTDIWDKFLEWKGSSPHVTMPADALEEGRSPAGAYNMAGNVAEWTSDWFSEDTYYEAYLKGNVTDPTGPSSGSTRVIRGGSWADRMAVDFQTTTRKGVAAGTRVDWLGFRCAGETK